MEDSSTAAGWVKKNVQRFRRLLYLAAGLFVVLEIAAALGVIPYLRPLSLLDVTANILFAIGFGCPFVLHVSSLPRWRELIGTVIVGAMLAVGVWQFHRQIGLPPEYKPEEVAVAEVITGLGLASLGAMILSAWRSTGQQRTTTLAYLMPAAVAMLVTMEAGMFLCFIKGVCPTSRDPSAYVADAAYGMQWSFALGQLFAAAPLLRIVCFAIYVAPPPAIIFVYALQTKARRPPPVDAATVLLAVFVIGYSLYFVYPICGPRVAFGDAFPNSPPSVDGMIGTRLTIPGENTWPNGMPSLHIASVILAYWQARPYGIWARAAGAVFLVGTFLATLGTGEHYLIDLVVAVPLCLAVYAVCMPDQARYRRERRLALLAGAALFAAWYGVLFLGIELFVASPIVAWGLALGSTATVWWLERRLYRAAFGEPEPAALLAPAVA